MTDVVARLRFKSIQRPSEYGTLLLRDDGTFQIEPSDEFRDEMARLEEAALRRSQTYGIGLGMALIVVGALAVGAGWLIGRIFGKLGSSLSLPRPIRDVEIVRNAGGGLGVQLHGVENRLQTIQMAWNGDEILLCEADAFVQKFEEMKGAGGSA